MSKAKQAKQAEKEVFVGSQRGKNRDAFGLQKLSMKMFEAKVARQKAMSKPEEV
jgi:hypothetical protein